MSCQRCVAVVILLAFGCADSGSAPRNPPTTAALYRDFLAHRALAERNPERDPGRSQESERQAFEVRKTMDELLRGMTAKRVLLENAESQAPLDQPSESLYFKLWSGSAGDGPKPMFTRLEDGGIEVQGRKIARQQALQCAVPARVSPYAYTEFLGCLAAIK